MQQFLPLPDPCLLLIYAWMFYKYPIFINKANPKAKDSVLNLLPSVVSTLPFFGCTEFVSGLSEVPISAVKLLDPL